MKAADIENYVSEKLGVSTKPPRFYYWEAKGLFGKINRTNNDKRNYTDKDIKKIVKIIMLKEIGLSTRIIKQIMVDENPKAKELALEKIQLLEDVLLPKLKTTLTIQ